jgi:hypothetical protein
MWYVVDVTQVFLPPNEVMLEPMLNAKAKICNTLFCFHIWGEVQYLVPINWALKSICASLFRVMVSENE